jgi:phosphoribosylglycinamide formyltransferase 1
MTTGITFLCSGGGGNLRLLDALIERGALRDCRLSGVIADRECPALEWARVRRIPARLIAYTRARPDDLREVLAQLAPDLIVTTIHKILDDEIVTHYEGRLVNLHYSLLPAFGASIGMEPVRLARAKGCRLIGATAHRVTADLDAGPILAQACIAVDAHTPQASLHDAVFRCGAVALAAAIEGLVAPGAQDPGGVLQADQVGIFASPRPRAEVCDALREPVFWQSLR